jgi:scyllo-inositol 2-dehydrogenase (NADP+)
MRKILILTDPEATASYTEQLAAAFTGHDHTQIHQTTNLDILTNLDGHNLLVIAGALAQLSPAQEKSLCQWVNAGGGLIAIHAASEISNHNAHYSEMLGTKCLQPGPIAEFNVNISDGQHEITRNFCEFRAIDRVLALQRTTECDLHWLLSHNWRGQISPLSYVREYGQGRVFYTTLGHDVRAIQSPHFQRMIRRAAAWTTRAIRHGPIRCGLIGYGGTHSMGKAHTDMIRGTAGLKLTAICEPDPRRLETARKDHPDIEPFASVKELVASKKVDIATIVTPHSTHAPIALELLEAGIGVICEKPFCLNTKEADQMIATARRQNALLTVFQNRRWDPDFLTIQQIIARGLLGDVFQIEAYQGEYKHPGYWWRSDKAISGGAVYDWGAHFIDWILHLIPHRIEAVTGFFSKRQWQDVTIEDHCKIIIRFEGSRLAEFELSHLAAVPKPKWRILGTHGGLTAGWDPPIRVTSHAHGLAEKLEVPHVESRWSAEFYLRLVDHLLAGEHVPVPPESARRVIALIEAAEKSNESGLPESVPGE